MENFCFYQLAPLVFNNVGAEEKEFLEGIIQKYGLF